MTNLKRLGTGGAMAALVLGVATVAHAQKYVAPDGTGDGSSWANATNNVQGTIDAWNGSDVIYLKYGAYSNTASIVISNKLNLSISGGYAGEVGGTPGATTNLPTVLTRSLSVSNRIVYGYNSTTTLERVTITNGLLATVAGNIYGAGLYMENCRTVLRDCRISGNRITEVTGASEFRGGGLYAINGFLSASGTTFFANSIYQYNHPRGGGLYAENVTVSLTNCVFDSNYVSEHNDGCNAGGMYLLNGSANIVDCLFTNNYGLRNQKNNTQLRGGGIYASGVNPLNMTRCRVTRNYLDGLAVNAHEGGAVYLAGVTAVIADSQFVDNDGSNPFYTKGDFWIASGTVLFLNTEIRGSKGTGLYVQNSTAITMTNCLVAMNGGNGVQVAAGTVRIVNGTLADNGGWGLQKSGGTVSLRNCIAWNNGAGGITGSPAVTNTCSQETQTGANNMVTNPVFVYGYYLSVNGQQGQTVDSPCIDAGADTAATLGFSALTTRTDGQTDGTGDGATVNLGWHSAAGLSSSTMSNTTLYVDAGAGDDGNSGLASGAGNALKTIGKALSKAINGTTINIATGTYSTVMGETFPLRPVVGNISLVGADKVTTTVRSDGANPVFICGGLGRLRFEELTIEGGTNISSATAAGLSLAGCQTTIRNCLIQKNTLGTSGSGDGRYGGGIFAMDGTLNISGSTIASNLVQGRIDTYGAGIYASGVAVTLSNSTLSGNGAVHSDGSGYAGGMALLNGSLAMVDCVVTNNYGRDGYGNYNHYGGGLYLSGVNPVRIQSCQFQKNRIEVTGTLTAGVPYGGDIYWGGSSAGSIVSCTVQSNTWQGAGVNRGNAEIYVASGTLNMTNNLIAKNMSNGVFVAAGTVTVVNCTLAENATYGVNIVSGTVSVRNSIVWGNVLGGILNPGTVTYSDVQGTLVSGAGNDNTDPSFVNTAAGDYHEKSKAGSWHNDVNDWRTDTVHSVCIDKGDPADAWSAEPAPNAARINMGAYGGTAYASKTYVSSDTQASVTNLGATAVRRQSVRLWGQILASGTESGLLPISFYYWPDGGASNIVPMANQTTNAPFFKDVSGLSGNTTYSYQVFGTNGAGPAWSEVKSFTTLTPQATNWYVARDGAGSTGMDWATALTNLQDAINEAVSAGDSIYIKSGVYSNSSQIVLSNRILSIRGAYAGSGDPGSTSSVPTVITRTAGSNMRLVYGESSTVTLERVTLNNGNLTDGSFGAGLYLTNCTTTLNECLVQSNALVNSGGAYGGAIYCVAGKLTGVGTSFLKNSADGTAAYGVEMGGGIYADGVEVILTNCVFDSNSTRAQNRCNGAAVYLNNGSANVTECLFTNNTATDTYGRNSPGSYGGVLYASSANPLVVKSCRFVRNAGTVTVAPEQYRMYGSVLYLEGTSVTGQMTSCTVYSNGTTSAVASNCIYLASGRMGMTNNLVARNMGDGILCAAGTATVVNCTIADNTGWGITNTAGVVTGWNNIVWGNTLGGVTLSPAPAFTYSDVQGAPVLSGAGNISSDPLFVGNGDYHEKGTGGSWHNGAWTRDPVDSPCLDTGDPASPYTLEPYPNGKRINMGAYGNTAQASKVYVPRGAMFIVY